MPTRKADRFDDGIAGADDVLDAMVPRPSGAARHVLPSLFLLSSSVSGASGKGVVTFSVLHLETLLGLKEHQSFQRCILNA